jgi:hypothetical protein
MARLSDWLRKQNVRPGEWYGEAKAFARTAMRSARLSTDAFQVLVSLRLHTMPYQSELAVTMRHGKRCPLSPSDIAKETDLSRQNVRRALVQLESAGFAQRKPIGDGGLRKGNVQVYCFTVPHSPVKAPYKTSHDFNLSHDVLKLVRRFRIPLPADFAATSDYRAYVEAAAERYKEAEMVAVRELKQAFFVAPGAPPYREERRGLKEIPERDPSTSSTSKAVATTTSTLKRLHPERETALVLAALANVDGCTDEDAAKQLLRECCRVTQDCTAADVCTATEIKAPQAKRARNPTGFLLTAVPKLLAGDGLHRIRDRQQAERHVRETGAAATRQREVWLATELELDAQVDAEWEAMGEAERWRRTELAAKKLKTEKRWQQLSPDSRKIEAENSARQGLRRELEAGPTRQ